MSAKFITASQVDRQLLPGMGDLGMIGANANSQHVVFGDLIFAPGDGFGFHEHPSQEEVLYVIDGSLEAWIEGEKKTIGSGDTMYLPAGTVHACFNVTDQPTKVFVLLTPVIESEEMGFELVDRSGDAPYSSYR
jgi:quercetin dioxygenase-like cupin family protein